MSDAMEAATSSRRPRGLATRTACVSASFFRVWPKPGLGAPIVYRHAGSQPVVGDLSKCLFCGQIHSFAQASRMRAHISGIRSGGTKTAACRGPVFPPEATEAERTHRNNQFETARANCKVAMQAAAAKEDAAAEVRNHTLEGANLWVYGRAPSMNFQLTNWAAFSAQFLG